jgi:imidazolonepropionase-like amidohydrolase
MAPLVVLHRMLTPRQGGTLVTSHCFTSEGARNAIEAGIGGIEHGNLIDEDTLRLMAKKGVHLTPTLIVCDVSGDDSHGFTHTAPRPSPCLRRIPPSTSST